MTILLSGCASNLPYYAADIAVQYGQRNTVQSLGSFVTEQQILNSIRQ
ncbi:MAG: hypothetical protein WC679_00695 [Bacteroidales bacterium]